MIWLMHRVYWFVALIIALLAGSANGQSPRQATQRSGSTAADSADYKCVWANFDTLRTANGVGVKRRTSDNGKACATRWISRVDSVVVPPTNTAPIAAFTVNNTTGKCIADAQCVLDATTSRDDKAVTGYTWDCGVTPACATSGAKASVVYPKTPNTRTVVLTVRDAEGLTGKMTRSIEVIDTTTVVVPKDSVVVGDSVFGIIPPAVPRKVADDSPKPCTRSVDVLAGADLQAKLNAAVAGDCLELAPTGKWQGNFVLPTRSCTSSTGWITIRTKGVLDIPKTRITQAEGVKLAKIVNASNQAAFITAHPTSCWQIMHLNIQRDSVYTGLVYHLVVLGDGGWAGGGEFNTSLAKQPSKIILRRNWIHGQANTELVRCVVANGIDIAVVDNYIDDCHASGFDSQAVEGWNGAGPTLLRNNFLAGAGENVMFGGADPADSSLTPSDITILNNHFYKNPAWKGVWSIKNGLELKNARRVLVDGNVFDPCSWASSQVGMCVVVKSSTGGSTTILNQGTIDLTFINNRANSANRGFNVQGYDCSYTPCTTLGVNRVLVQNNLFTNIGVSNGVLGADGWLIPTTDAPQNVLFRNNTFVGNAPNRGLTTYLTGRPGSWASFRAINNIFAGQSYYAIGADGCPQPYHKAALDCVIGPGKWTFSGNVVSQVNQEYWSLNPAGNTYKVTIGEIGFLPDYSAPNYPGKGVDITTLTQKTAGVVVAPPATRSLALPITRPRFVHPTRADSLFCARAACSQ